MNWTVRPATVADAEYVYDHLWERGIAELLAYGVSRMSWMTQCIQMIATRNGCVVFVHNDAPAALLGVAKAGKIGRTWFQATSEARDEIAALTRQLRRWMKRLAVDAGVSVTYLYSLCISPDAPRWFAFLGFGEDLGYEGEMFNGSRERRFVRTWE